MQRPPAAQVSAPPLTVTVASAQAAPSALVPAGAQPVWPVGSVPTAGSASAGMSPVHFPPVAQPVCAIGSQVAGTSPPESSSFGGLLPPHAAASPISSAPKTRFFICCWLLCETVAAANL